MRHLITIGHSTRKHGAALVYDVATREGCDRFLTRLYDLNDVDLRRELQRIDDAPSYIRTVYSVTLARSAMSNELAIRTTDPKEM